MGHCRSAPTGKRVTTMEKKLNSPGILSVEVGGRLLHALAESRQAMTLTALAAAAKMPTSKARRYLVSFLNIGLVEQDMPSGHYSPGPLALRIGVAALAKVDVVRQAEPIMRELRDSVNETVVLAILGDNGPVIIRREDSYRAITLNIRIGSVLSTEQSATGLIFAAYRLPHGMRGRSAKRLQYVRKQGYAEVEGSVMAGLYGLSVPILDGTDHIHAALTITTHLEGLNEARRAVLRNEMGRAAKRFILP